MWGFGVRRLAPAAVICVSIVGVIGAPATAAPEASGKSRTSNAASVARIAGVAIPRNRTVVVWGDSLAWEARDYLAFLGAANGMPTEVRSFGGSAICDWFADMRAHLRATRPAVVVLA